MPRQVKGSIIRVDKAEPQNETMFITLSLAERPHPGTKQGHIKHVTIVNATAGIPKTRICRIDSIFAPYFVQDVGWSLSSSCILAHPFRFHHLKCAGNAPSSTTAPHNQQK